jgi:tryptophan synthase alpha chain
MFDGLRARGEGAFVPFLVLGDPDPATSLELVRALVRSGADALELGLPFSDPIADGPVIQAAATRALASGVRVEDCWAIVARVREEHPTLPIGLLVYANLVMHENVHAFYAKAAAAGVDSVLVADAPLLEVASLAAAARDHGIAPVCIAPPNADEGRLAAIAAISEAYVYVTSRAGVTGADDRLRAESAALLAQLRRLTPVPTLLGFGISNPAQVREALALGPAGVISGSAVVRHVELQPRGPGLITAVSVFVAAMKAATLPSSLLEP